MSVRRLAAEQPEGGFVFNAENRAWAEGVLGNYPQGREQSAVIPLLWRAQEQAGGWLPEAAIGHVAEMLAMPRIRVYEIATFYTMFNLAPVGRHLVQVCATTPCWLRGSDELERVCREEIGEAESVSEDGALTWRRVECLGACVNAPVVQVNADYHEDLDGEALRALLQRLRSGGASRAEKMVAGGSHMGRHSSEPLGASRTGSASRDDLSEKAAAAAGGNETEQTRLELG